MARALVRLYPEMRELYMKYDFLKTDYRQKERKKIGRYRARKGWPYVRR